MVIPDLAPTLNRSLKSDGSLYPVRAFRYYLDRTPEFLQNKELVFVSFKKGFDKDISPVTILGDPGPGEPMFSRSQEELESTTQAYHLCTDHQASAAWARVTTY